MPRTPRHLPMAAFVVALLAFDITAVRVAVPLVRDAFHGTRLSHTALRAQRLATATGRAVATRAAHLANDAMIGAIKSTTSAYHWMLTVTPAAGSLAEDEAAADEGEPLALAHQDVVAAEVRAAIAEARIEARAAARHAACAVAKARACPEVRIERAAVERAARRAVERTVVRVRMARRTGA